MSIAKMLFGTKSEKKEVRKEKFKDEYDTLSKKDYDSLSKNDKKKYDFAKENNLIVGRKKKGTAISDKKHVHVFDPVDYDKIQSSAILLPVEKKLERKYIFAAECMISHRINAATKKHLMRKPIDKSHQLELAKVFAKHARYINEAMLEINNKRSEISKNYD